MPGGAGHGKWVARILPEQDGTPPACRQRVLGAPNKWQGLVVKF
jgi:hypothetical protein